jgi:pimeloyl-ACP methyl ester carboxylesterase
MLLLAASTVARAEEFDSAGVKIHYTVNGKGDPVILIHGLFGSAAMNWDWPGTTADLAKHYQVIAGAGHLNCIAKPEFKKKIETVLAAGVK